MKLDSPRTGKWWILITEIVGSDCDSLVEESPWVCSAGGEETWIFGVSDPGTVSVDTMYPIRVVSLTPGPLSL